MNDSSTVLNMDKTLLASNRWRGQPSTGHFSKCSHFLKVQVCSSQTMVRSLKGPYCVNTPSSQTTVRSLKGPYCVNTPSSQTTVRSLKGPYCVNTPFSQTVVTSPILFIKHLLKLTDVAIPKIYSSQSPMTSPNAPRELLRCVPARRLVTALSVTVRRPTGVNDTGDFLWFTVTSGWQEMSLCNKFLCILPIIFKWYAISHCTYCWSAFGCCSIWTILISLSMCIDSVILISLSIYWFCDIDLILNLYWFAIWSHYRCVLILRHWSHRSIDFATLISFSICIDLWFDLIINVYWFCDIDLIIDVYWFCDLNYTDLILCINFACMYTNIILFDRKRNCSFCGLG